MNEEGTTASVATVALMMALGIQKPPPKPIEIHVDHPFLFAIQETHSGACLMLGRVTDPR